MLDKFLKIIKKILPQKWQWLLEHEGLKRYSANISWLFLGQFFSLAVSFFIGAWIARYLGPANYGTISYIVAFVGIFGFIADLGITNTINRELIKTPEKSDELLGVGFILRIIGGLAAFSLILFSTLFLKTTVLIKVLIILYSTIFIFQAFGIIAVFFQAKVKSKHNVYAQTLAIIMSSFLKVILILLGKGIIWLTIIYTLDVIWQSVFYIFVYYRQGFNIWHWKFNKTIAKSIWHDSWPLMLSAAAAYIYLRIDQVLIGQMLDIKAVGFYAAAVKIAEIIYFIPTIICTSLFPAIINAKKTNAELYHQRLSKLYKLMLATAIFISVPLTIFSHWIIVFLFGSAYALSAQILSIYTWSSIGVFLGIAMTQYLMAENLTKIIFISTVTAMITNIALNLILIPRIGLNGAAYATLISYFVVPLMVFLYNKFKK